jgi:hypothetical protein
VLELPVRPPAESDRDLAPFEPPDQGPALPMQVLTSAPATHEVRRDPATGMLEFENDPEGTGTWVLLDSDLEVSAGYRDLYSIQEHDPLSARVTCDRSYELARGDWRIRVQTTSTMTSTTNEFLVDDKLEAFEGGNRVFVKSWSRSFPRDLV